ncbi:hypothetical protein PPERSA_05169 [Pseudocohnilembus persalinus]|uniref:Transmembrane protein n=1 Tax=Pseudocohnilembus persalinus TaxID=266149 RepID=A0A0V0R989_PSEPJ|nr:hypothetical protein PPERSA_05169 [Pseudocohnilembus persalinus]|eukprot:KRX11060.1 hypothetical protein PPERSA_05169 [Pseudocohnilembus persalinus]
MQKTIQKTKEIGSSKLFLKIGFASAIGLGSLYLLYKQKFEQKMNLSRHKLKNQIIYFQDFSKSEKKDQKYFMIIDKTTKQNLDFEKLKIKYSQINTQCVAFGIQQENKARSEIIKKELIKDKEEEHELQEKKEEDKEENKQEEQENKEIQTSSSTPQDIINKNQAVNQNNKNKVEQKIQREQVWEELSYMSYQLPITNCFQWLTNFLTRKIEKYCRKENLNIGQTTLFIFIHYDEKIEIGIVLKDLDKSTILSDSEF